MLNNSRIINEIIAIKKKQLRYALMNMCALLSRASSERDQRASDGES